MEADITSQAVGLSGSVDFSLMSLFERHSCQISNNNFDSASIYSWAIIIEKFKMFKRIDQSTVEFEENSGNLNLLKVFIIIFPLIKMTQCPMFLEKLCK